MVHIKMKCHHLNFVGESYVQHLRFTIQLSFDLLLLSFVSIVHGLCPWILTGKVSDRIKELNSILTNDEYRR